MEEISRTFKKPTSEDECETIRCQRCVAMVNILLTTEYDWECFNMKKARAFRKVISLKEGK